MRISYGIRNLRSFEDMEPIELRPITLLVGANSSGKSTFLRSISLLRQSLTEKIEEPILWYKEDFLDFGDFSTAVKDRESDREISFKFRFDGSPLKESALFETYDIKIKEIDHIYYEIGVMKSGGNVIISSIHVVIEDINLSFSIKYDGKKYLYTLNNKNINRSISNEFYFDNLKLFENFDYAIDSTVSLPLSIRIGSVGVDLLKKTFELIASNKDDNLIGESYAYATESLKIACSYPLKREEIKELKNTTETVEMKNFYDSLLRREHSDLLDSVKLNSALYLIIHCQNELNSILNRIMLNSTRVGPARVLNNRYYRAQSLDSSDISVDGKNLPMFLLKLKKNDLLDEFSEWISKMIGYGIDIIGDFANVEIIVNKNGVSENLIDTGYGISQILPILAQIWLSTFGRDSKFDKILRNRSEPKSIFLMEQPELHLHPYHQAQLAEALASSITESKNGSDEINPIFLVETHSEDLINRLGTLIQDRELSEEDVQVVIFSRGHNGAKSTKVEIATYNNDGTLNNWPYGFFNYRHAY